MSDIEAKNSSESLRRAKRKKKERIRKIVKYALFGAAGVAILGGIVMSLLPKPIVVDLTEVRRGPMSVTIDEDGKTRAMNRYVISAPLTGNMNRIPLAAGDHVEEGEAILRIVPAAPPLLDKRSRANAETRLAAAKAGLQLAGAEVARAKAALEQAESNATKVRGLAKAGAVPANQLESAEFALRARKEELRAAQFSAKVRRQDEASARAALGLFDKSGSPEESMEITAPVSGSVLRVFREHEQGLVAAGTPLIEIADLGTLEIEADVLTADAVHIEPGDYVRVIRWGGDAVIDGSVHRVEPSAFSRLSALGVEEQRVVVNIHLDSPRELWKSLGDGFRVEVEIATWEGDDVMTVPASSVFRHEGKWAVFVSEGGKARLTPVEIGHRNDTQVEILSGLALGARVVTHPSDRVVDGIEIEPTKDAE